jgi:hypothetical protein
MEILKDVVGYEGFYQVSNEGRVRSLVRLLPEAHARGVRQPKKILAFGSNKQGRLQVVLCMHAKPTRFQVHTLVLTAFKGARPSGLECRHLDGDYTNNHESNLEWGTHAQNMRDKVAHGTQAVGEAAHRARLTDAQVRAIRVDNRSQRDIAKEYGVTQVSVFHIKHRKTWKHLA